MPTVALSARFVRRALCPDGRKKIDLFDACQRGFMLEVRCSGGKTYYQRYTDERGRERQYKLGPHVRTYKSSWRTDETVLRIHILPTLGKLALDEIKSDAICDLVNRMRDDGYACGTINRVIVILRFLYNLARKWKVAGIVGNPATGLTAGPDVQRNRFLSEEEAEVRFDQ